MSHDSAGLSFNKVRTGAAPRRGKLPAASRARSSDAGARKSMSSSLAPFHSSVSRRALRDFGGLVLQGHTVSRSSPGYCSCDISPLHQTLAMKADALVVLTFLPAS